MDKTKVDTKPNAIHFLGQKWMVVKKEEGKYRLVNNFGISMWIPKNILKAKLSIPLFHDRSAHIMVIDNFVKYPNIMVEIAKAQKFVPDIRYYKGERTQDRFLWPGLREQFESLLNVEITDWLEQPYNGVFQMTRNDDPLVWHSDLQDYAGAIYLTPDAGVDSGTSFWKHKETGCRRPPAHDLEITTAEKRNFGPAAGSPDEHVKQLKLLTDSIYSEKNILSPDPWELVDRVGSVYGRLVLWDGRMIHSATSYDKMSKEKPRLVQLFFFNVKK